MANRKRAPEEVETLHTGLLTSAAEDLAQKRAVAWEAELILRERVRDAFDDGMTVGPIRVATNLSTPRLYQIKNEDLDKIAQPA
jgi:hypothetical protein